MIETSANPTAERSRTGLKWVLILITGLAIIGLGFGSGRVFFELPFAYAKSKEIPAAIEKGPVANAKAKPTASALVRVIENKPTVLRNGEAPLSEREVANFRRAQLALVSSPQVFRNALRNKKTATSRQFGPMRTPLPGLPRKSMWLT
jgi:hypothetical protein